MIPQNSSPNVKRLTVFCKAEAMKCLINFVFMFPLPAKQVIRDVLRIFVNVFQIKRYITIEIYKRGQDFAFNKDNYYGLQNSYISHVHVFMYFIFF